MDLIKTAIQVYTIITVTDSEMFPQVKFCYKDESYIVKFDQLFNKQYLIGTMKSCFIIIKIVINFFHFKELVGLTCTKRENQIVEPYLCII